MHTLSAPPHLSYSAGVKTHELLVATTDTTLDPVTVDALVTTIEAFEAAMPESVVVLAFDDVAGLLLEVKRYRAHPPTARKSETTTIAMTTFTFIVLVYTVQRKKKENLSFALHPYRERSTEATPFLFDDVFTHIVHGHHLLSIIMKFDAQSAIAPGEIYHFVQLQIIASTTGHDFFYGLSLLITGLHAASGKTIDVESDTFQVRERQGECLYGIVHWCDRTFGISTGDT